ncbi:hypothetical protein AT15_05810 [Kosmotoga arenicorallina S304]|uniref:DUF4932 domain-containing protein n=1 Tax=Kosmotoga arenicorallina S304 TaxID=1453497 RepID=A0A182C7I6_9BACT|nr:hypothetical protein [Kosmotoga arenicorallina]OAA31589.1 hypothetical protein AT15_05810 [Kosmotoga arenicorallina S304]
MKSLFIPLIFMILLGGCVALFITKPMERALVGEVEVRPPVLKYSMISTLEEMYYANIKAPEKWKSYYSDVRADSRAHYLWLLDTYYALPSAMKENLKTIFENTHAWRLLNIATLLSDESTIDDLVRVYKGAIIGSNSLPVNVRNALEKLLPYYYETFFKDYFEENAPKFEKVAKQMTEEAREYPNPYQFISDNSRIDLGKSKCLFYYTFREVGAYGFKLDELRISTLQRDVDSIEKLFFTPLHEYSHEFFQTFTGSKEFKELTEELKIKDPQFYEHWHSDESLSNSYSWRGFCEENLVEGFAKFLRDKFYGNIQEHRAYYYYDMDFYEYLKDIDFSPDDISLMEASLNFYSEKCK